MAAAAGLLGTSSAAMAYSVDYYDYGLVLGAIGLLLLAVSTLATLPMRIFLASVPKAGDVEARRMRYWGRLKSAAILLNLLVFLGVASIVVGAFVRAGYLDAFIALTTVLRVVSILIFAIVVTMTYTHITSLRINLVRNDSRPTIAIVLNAFLGASVMAGVAFTLRGEELGLGGFAVLGYFDAPLFLLLGACIAAAGLTSARSLPTVLVLLKGDQRYYRGRTYVSSSKSVVLPSVVAFSALFVVFLALVLFGVGADSLQEPTHLGVLGFIALAMMISIAVSIRLARGEDYASLFRVHKDAQTRVSITILAVSLSAAFLVGVLALLVRQGSAPVAIAQGRWVDLLATALLLGLGPYGFYIAYRHRHVRRVEERFPDLLRDIAASHRGGLTLSNAVAVASRGDYGHLSAEVHQMANQLSWSVPFDEALQQLSQRVKTPLIERTCSLITEASHSGGNTTDVLLAAAHDAREIKNLETDRMTSMGLYTIIIYVTFFVFLTVAALLYASFVPVLIQSAEAAKAASAGGGGAFAIETPSLRQYRDFYFLGALVQAVGNGLVAGLMGAGRVLDGLRHSFLMVLFSYATFALVI